MEDNKPNNSWITAIPYEQWQVYQAVIDTVCNRDLPFALGGAFALATYTGRWRNTKDLDLYVLPSHHQEVIDLVEKAGLKDYYEKLPYDRNWIYRSYQEIKGGDPVIIDVIWSMANSRADIDTVWVKNGPELEVRGNVLRVIPPEELIWGKLYVMQKERSDWPDILNIIQSTGPDLNWEHLLARIRDDDRLLASLLSIFAWLNPERAAQLPTWLWSRLGVQPPDPNPSPGLVERHAMRLDTRPWFGPLIQDE